MIGNALLTYASTSDPEDPRITFWRDPSRWPQDAGGYIFAARALLRLGQRLFPGEWSDHSPLTEHVAELPERLWLSTPRSEIDRGVRVLRQSDTSYARRVGFGRGLLANWEESQFPTTDEWAEAVELTKVARQQSWTKLLPFYKAGITLWHACLEGKVRSATRDRKGGAFEGREWHFWNYELAWARFDLCRVDLSQPDLSNSRTESFDWLFIDENSLEAFLSAPSSQENLSNDATERVHASETKRRRAGRRPKYDWQYIAKDFGTLHASGEIDEETSNSAIADLLLDRVADAWEDLPDKRAVEGRVSEWRALHDAIPLDRIASD